MDGLEEDPGRETDVFMPPVLMHFQVAADRLANQCDIYNFTDKDYAHGGSETVSTIR